MKTELDEITPELQKAIVFKEDKYFFWHYGVNPLAIARAAFNNVVKGKRTSGASTITMQVVRLLQPQSRTYWNKIGEMLRAVQLEWHCSKKEILQLYLNLVPYGSNIEGVKSASVLFFDKTPGHLSLAEITTLAIVPNRPTSLALGKHNPAVQKERNRWLTIFKKNNVFAKLAIEDAISEELTVSRLNAPKNAPHLASRLKAKYPEKAIIQTTIKGNIQLKAEQLVTNYIQRKYHQRIRNAAVMVINNKTREVEAYIGSADFFNSEDAGQVDGVRAIRSPGSTLKPFVYGLAFDRGIVTPKLKISDVPINFSGYSPTNYDETYNGMVTIEFALAHSLNVPSVKVLNEYGTDLFIDKLAGAGFEQIRNDKDRNRLGLSVVLGGCGVSLEELTKLYSAFANKGEYQGVKWLKNAEQEGREAADTTILKKSILSEAAAYIITDILTQPTRPDFPQNFANTMHLPKIAWKTGTSYGRRDAWSIGYNANYTVGVWTGNFSGEGVPELTGASIATPLLFNIFNSIDYNTTKDWFVEPSTLDYRWVCSHSGLPPNAFCEDQVMDHFMPLVSTTETCSHLQEIFVSPDETHSYCRSCLPEVGYKKMPFPVYAPEIVAFYEKEHIRYEKIPTHNPKCERIFSGNPPEIISPIDGLDYIIDRTDNDQLMLSCNVSNDVKTVYWYINEVFYQSSEATANLFFTPNEGESKVTCVDDKGRKREVTVAVRFL